MVDESLAALLREHGQEHLLRWWGEISEDRRSSLRRQLAGLNFTQAQDLFRKTRDQPAAILDPDRCRPAPVLRLPLQFEEWEKGQSAAALGEAALKAGHVAIVMVAGGLGTRLGYPGPKGTFAIGPVTDRTLFQIHAEKVLALGRRHGPSLPFYIMTSRDNDAATRAFFAAHQDFGLEPGQVRFFEQREMPVLDKASGKILLAAKDEIATSPNGHGGVIDALERSGSLDDMQGRGIRHVYYFQVDNPLAKVADAVFLGQHIAGAAEMSLKVLPKKKPAEKMGALVEIDGRPQVIEYSDLPAVMAEKRDAGGALEFWAGSIAIHLFELAFLKRLASGGIRLPFHRAVKTVPFRDEAGNLVEPAEPNAVKFEMFIFDALPLANKTLAVETSRAQEFEPLKNAEGDNSPATVRQALSDLYQNWLRQAGADVPKAGAMEISPLIALDAEDLRGKSCRLRQVAQGWVLDEVKQEENQGEDA
jgi:UDP-N-acetylglucosamine/UDP-N-acetylgalactosamine diphosphorylase